MSSNKKKDDMFFIDAKDLLHGVDFEIVTDTAFNQDLVKHFFELENHDIDVDLALMLGLGVIKNLHIDNDFYIYNASNDQPDSFGLINEFTRISVYYQITHPHYDDKKLEEFILGTYRGRKLLKRLQTVDSDMPYTRLKQIFAHKREGKIVYIHDNVGFHK